MTQNISAGRKRESVTITVNNKKKHNVQKEQLLLTTHLLLKRQPDEFINKRYTRLNINP